MNSVCTKNLTLVAFATPTRPSYFLSTLKAMAAITIPTPPEAVGRWIRVSDQQWRALNPLKTDQDGTATGHIDQSAIASFVR